MEPLKNCAELLPSGGLQLSWTPSADKIHFQIAARMSPSQWGAVGFSSVPGKVIYC